MAKLPVVKPKQVIKALERANFFIHRQVGSHVRLIHQTERHRRVTVPVHNIDIPKGTLKSILNQAGLSVEDLIKLL